MGKDNLENIFSSKLNERKPNLDYDSLWRELEPRLPKKKKFVWPFWFMMIPLILVAFTSFLYLSYNVEETIQNQPVDAKISQNLISRNHTNTSKAEPKKPIKNNITSTPELKTSIKENTTTNDPLPQAGHPNADFSLLSKDLNQSNTETSISTSISSEDGGVRFSESDVENVNSNEVRNPFTQKINTTIPEPIQTERASLALSYLALLSNHLTAANRDIPKMNLGAITVSSLYNDVAGNPVTHALRFTIVGLYGQSRFSPGSDTDQGYTTALSSTLSPVFGYASTLGYDIQLANGFFAGIDLSYTDLIQKFELHNEPSQQEDFYNDQAFVYSGNFVGATSEVEVVQKQDILKYNTYTFLDIVPHIGYRYAGALSFSIEVGPSLNIYQSFDGKSMDPRGYIIHDGSQLYKENDLLNGIYIGSSLSKDITEKTSLSATVHFKTRSSFTNTSNTLFDQQLRTFGLGIGIQYRL